VQPNTGANLNSGNPVQQTSGSVANQAGNFAGAVMSSLPWYYRR
jgi:hypothetical protein